MTKRVRNLTAVAVVSAVLAAPAAVAGQQPRPSDGGPPVVGEVRNGGFDWGAAAIGAAAAFGFVLLTGGAALVLRPTTKSQEGRRRHG